SVPGSRSRSRRKAGVAITMSPTQEGRTISRRVGLGGTWDCWGAGTPTVPGGRGSSGAGTGRGSDRADGDRSFRPGFVLVRESVRPRPPRDGGGTQRGRQAYITTSMRRPDVRGTSTR